MLSEQTNTVQTGSDQNPRLAVDLMLSVHHSEAEPVTTSIFSGPQGLPQFLPEHFSAFAGTGPTQVRRLLHQLPHAVVRRQQRGGDLLQEHQDQHILLLIKQTEAGQRKKKQVR